MKTTGLLENTTFLLLYILFNFILKETYTTFYTGYFNWCDRLGTPL